ncbi:MAG: hypothetical protein GF307_06595 [candidate division Zixibacteria bacterium]|nr:hypothetical protein [candidate division Zixibacteria bacterium]
MKKLILISIFLIIILAPIIAIADTLDATARVDSTSGTIGDIFHLEVNIIADTNLTVSPPSIDKKVGEFEVLGISEPSIKDSSGLKVYNLGYRIAAYQTGELFIPSLEITAQDTTGEKVTAVTDSILVNIASVLPQQTAAESLAIKDIKPIVEYPFPYWRYIIIIGAVLIIAGLVIFLLRKRKGKKGVFVTPAKPPDPPWVVASRMLEELKDARYAEKGEFKLFYFKLSEIAKYYIDKRFGLPAIERTTSEIKIDFDRYKPSELDDSFIEFLDYSDLVKFAKYPSTLSESSKWFDYVEDLVIRTKPGRELQETDDRLEKVE